MDRKTYENIVWVGGQYSPPTKGRVFNVVDAGKKILEQTPKGAKSLVCIVPMSGNGRNVPPGISQECITNEHRWIINQAFLRAIIYEAALAGQDFSKIEYILSNNEIISAGEVSVKESIEAITLQYGRARNIYIAKPLGTILLWMRRETDDSQYIINNYSFYIWPEKKTDILTISAQIREALIKNNPKVQKYLPITSNRFYRDLMDNRITLIQPDKPYQPEDPITVRDIIGRAGPINPGELDSYLHPIVIDSIRALEIDYPKLYQSKKCKESWKLYSTLQPQ
jgi:hypothetical protein